MIPQYDIFLRLPDGHPVWVKAVNSLEEAQHQLAQMAQDKTSPADYFIFDSKDGKVTTAGTISRP